MVFQSYALYPHMSVADNIAYPLRVRGVGKAERAAAAARVAETLEIEHLLKRRPRQLSGGQRQRIALARAIVREPAAFLMDEPLSNLDAKLRIAMRGEIKRLQKRLGATTLYVTHDQAEAHDHGRPGRGDAATATCSSSRRRTSSTSGRPTGSWRPSSATRR